MALAYRPRSAARSVYRGVRLRRATSAGAPAGVRGGLLFDRAVFFGAALLFGVLGGIGQRAAGGKT
ncbi:MAG: hypothetical protein U5M23_16410 [Marinagarivorans sp.]|nr:hypothetical protein [Marinagarivorans sp.]